VEYAIGEQWREHRMIDLHLVRKVPGGIYHEVPVIVIHDQVIPEKPSIAAVAAGTIRRDVKGPFEVVAPGFVEGRLIRRLVRWHWR